MTEIICPQCGKKQDESFKFCKNCGKSLIGEIEEPIENNPITSSIADHYNLKICPECGTAQNDEFKFCKNCGALLSDESENPPVIIEEDNVCENIDDETSKVQIEIENEEDTQEDSNDEIICPECGAKQDKSSRFCGNCGASFSDENKNQTTKRCSGCGAELKDEKFCPNCGKATGPIFCPECGQKIGNEKFCPNCGCRINQNANVSQMGGESRPPQGTTHKNAVLALILSFLFPGLGQLYNNQNRKGIILIIGYVISLVLSLILVGIILVFLIWIYGMYDAFTSAEAINKGEYLEDRIF